MGAEASKLSEQEQKEVEFLANRFPFADEELKRLYQAYRVVDEENQESSFSQIWDAWTRSVLQSSSSSSSSSSSLENTNDEEGRKDLEIVWQRVEQDILPASFGEKLVQTALYRPRLNDNVETKDPQREILEAHFEGLACGLLRRGGRAALGTLVQCYVPDKYQHCRAQDLVDPDGHEIKVRVLDVLEAAYRLSLATSCLRDKTLEERSLWFPDDDSSEVLQKLADSCIEFVEQERNRRTTRGDILQDTQDWGEGQVSKMDFLEWSESQLPLLSGVLPAFLHTFLFPEKPYPAPFHSFPQLSAESTIVAESNSALLFSFACMTTSLGGTWHRLYTPTLDGLSFNRLQNALLGYGGPTLLIISSTDGGVFGAFTSTAWKESKSFYGSPQDCFLYQLIPTTAVYRPIGSQNNFMYCNSVARSNNRDRLPHGIGFGGTLHAPRLFISESFDECVAGSRDMTFEPGPLLPLTQDGTPQKYFCIDSLEVWGCGGDERVAEALELRSQEREYRDARIEQARKVDKAAFLEDFRSGLIENKAFKHRDGINRETMTERNLDQYKQYIT